MSVELARKHAIATDESISFFFSFLNFRGEYKLMRNFVGFFFLKWPLHLVETLRERDFSFAVLLDGPLQTADDVTKSHNRETQTKGTDDEIIIFSSRERKREREREM